MLKRLLFVTVFSLLAITAVAQDNLYTSPDGLWTATLPQGWLVEENEAGYITIKSPDDAILLHFMTYETTDLEQSVLDAWALLDPEFDSSYTDDKLQVIEDAVLLQGFEKGALITYQEGTGADGALILGSASLFEGISYVTLIQTNLTGIQRRFAQYQMLATSFKATAMEAEVVLTDVAPAVWDESLSEELRAFVNESLTGLQATGAAVAIVQNGEVVFAEGFGAKNDAGDPVTPDTLMMIGSTTKSLSTLLMAQAVDAGAMAWESPVIEVLPSFAVKDPTITQEIVVQNLVCACTGVPRRDLEFLFNTVTAEDIVVSLQDFEFFTDFGEAFQYSNQMVAVGGYVAAVALTGEKTNLYENYVNLVDSQIFAPLGMARSTFNFDTVEADADVALPYGSSILAYQEMSVDEERWASPIAPAGAAWSSANDMAQYAIFALNKGVSANGERIVSEENLLRTWEPQIEVGANADYGLGWFIDAYKSVPLIHHGGNTFGYSSDFAFLPDNGFGIVILVNQQASAVPGLVRQFALELLYDQEQESRDTLAFSVKSLTDAVTEATPLYSETITDVETVSGYVGTFSNPVLGDLIITLDEEGNLSADAGEFGGAVWQRTNKEGEVAYIMAEPPLAGTELVLGETDGVKTITIGAGVIEYIFTFQS